MDADKRAPEGERKDMGGEEKVQKGDEPPTVLGEAKRCAARGWVPLVGKAGKRPFRTGWQKVTGETWASAWKEDTTALRAGGEEPCLSILTGEASGLWVLDIDVKHGGLERWLELEAEHGVVETPTVWTGGGGLHKYYEWEAGLPGNGEKCILTKDGVAVGIDIRSTAGQVVAPPTRHVSGKCYTWQEGTKDLPLAKVPAGLLAELMRAKAARHPIPPGGGEEGPAGAGAPATAKLEGLEPILGDKVTIAGRTVELTPELIGELLERLPCPGSASHWGGQLNNVKSVVADRTTLARDGEAYAVFDKWSKTGARYDEEANRKIWARTGRGGDIRTTIGQAVKAGFRLRPPPGPAEGEDDFTMYHLLQMRARRVTQDEVESAIRRCVKMVTASPKNIWLRRERNPETGEVRYNEAPSMADYAHVKFEVEGRKAPASLPELIEGISEQITCSGLGFIPRSPRAPRPEREVFYNTFQGYRAREAPNPEAIAPILEHISRVWCRRDERLTEYVYNWLAFLVQRPEEKVGTMLLLHSKQGAGKTILTDFIGNQILGPDLYRAVTMAKQLLGKFNAALVHRLLLVLNEANLTGPEWAALNDTLKGIITDPTVSVERKGLEVTTEKDYSAVIMCTNHRVSIRIEPSDRRTVCLDLASDHLGDRAYFARLIAAVRSPAAPGAFLAWLLNRDITAWLPADFPDTPMRRELMAAHTEGADRYLEERKEDFVPGFRISAEALYADYRAWSERNGEHNTSSSTKFGMSIVEQALLVRTRRRLPSGQKPTYYEHPGE